MKSPFKNDPFAMVAIAFERLYPSKTYMAYMRDDDLKDSEGNSVYGITTFPDDGSEPIIELSGTCTLPVGVEIFAHELSHVAAGSEVDHGKAFMDAFQKIFEEYNIIGAELFGDGTSGEQS